MGKWGRIVLMGDVLLLLVVVLVGFSSMEANVSSSCLEDGSLDIFEVSDI